MDSLFGCLVIGVIGGLLGAMFIRINNQVNATRKKILKTKTHKILETLVLTIGTVTVMYMAITLNYWVAGDKYQTSIEYCAFKNSTSPDSPDNKNLTVPTLQFLCQDDQRFDRLATLLFETQANTIKTFMSNQRDILIKNASIFIVIWYTFTCITSGVLVPAGIFLPCILIGCALGNIYGPLHNLMFHPTPNG